MGDRISISFTNKIYNTESIVLFSHWGGEGFLDIAYKYLEWLKNFINTNPNTKVMPIGRLEPQIVMIDFIRWLTKGKKIIDGNYYLGKDEKDGDNSDNGHYIIELTELFTEKKKKDLKELEELLKKNQKEILLILMSTENEVKL